MKVWRRIWLKSLFCFAERPSHALNFWQDVSLLTENKFYQLTKLLCRIIVQIEKVWKRQTLSGICYSLSTNQVVCFRSADFLSRTGLGVGFTPVGRSTCHCILCYGQFFRFSENPAQHRPLPNKKLSAAQEELSSATARFSSSCRHQLPCTRACSQSFHASNLKTQLTKYIVEKSQTNTIDMHPLMWELSKHSFDIFEKAH